MLLVEWDFKSAVERGKEEALRRARSGAREAEVKGLVEEGINGALTGAQRILDFPHFGSGWELIVE